MKRKNLLLSTVIGLLLCFWTALLFSCQKSGDPEGMASDVTAGFATVKLVSIQEHVTVSGNIEPWRSRNLSFSSLEKITDIEVEEGDHVTKGTVLARIDTSREEYAIEEKEYEWETLRYTESPRRIQLMEKGIESLKADLETKVITAPFDGIIASINQREGEIAIESSKEPLILFIDKSRLKASVMVDELDIARLSIGQMVHFFFDALPGETFEGKVSKIAIIGRLNQRGLPVTDVEIIIDDPDPRILIPYSFRAEILTSTPSDYLVLDEKAIIWRDDKIFVQLADPEDPENLIERNIRIKPWKDGRVIILEGLSEGDRVLMNTPPSADEISMGMF